MHDIEIVDRYGCRRRGRAGELPQDGETISIPVTLMDHAAYGFRPQFADGSVDYSNPHAPGFRFADSDDPDRLAAEEAYAERTRRLDYRTRLAAPAKEESAWLRRQALARRATAEAMGTGDTRQPTLDEVRARADAAYEARRQRMHYSSRYSRA
jgi:hypothetical protein